MPFSEHMSGGPGDRPPRNRPEGDDRAEREPTPYIRAARFTAASRAGHAYAQAEAALRRTPCDVSVYRFLLDQVAHVAVVGMPPPPALDARLMAILARGEAVTLPPTVQQALVSRREQVRHLGPWVEGHWRPGRRLTP